MSNRLHADDMQRVLLDVDLDIPTDRSSVHWTPALLAFRARIAPAMAKMRADGRSLSFTAEAVTLDPMTGGPR